VLGKTTTSFTHFPELVAVRSVLNKSLPVFLFLLCLLVFSRALMGEFVMDDWPVVKENSKITGSQYIPDYFTSGVWANTDLSEQTGVGGHTLYRPLFLLTINLAHQLWGDNAVAYHALNLGLHGINTVLVYFLIIGFFSSASRMTAGMAAAIFAVHPVHVESVAWIAGITDPLVSLFLLSGFLLHRRSKQLHSKQVQSKQSQPKQLASLLAAIGAPLCYALALLSKETAVLFPLILISYDALFHRRSLKTPAAIWRYAPYAVLLVMYFILRSHALNTDEITHHGLWSRMDFHHWPRLLEFTAHYIQLLFFPSPLEYYYTAPHTGSLALIVGGMLILGAMYYLVRALKPALNPVLKPGQQQEYRLYLLSLAWIVFFLLPALPIALFSEPVFAIRILYLPSVGFALFIAWLIHHAQHFSSMFTIVVKAVTAIMLLSFVMITVVETDDWANDTVFYTQAMKANPDSFKPVSGLATAKARENNIDYAIDLYLRAAELAPRESDQLDFKENAASHYGQTGNTQKSEELYQEILRHDPKRSSAWVGLGNNALARNNSQQALEYYQKAYKADPNNFVASYNLMLTYQSLGKLQQAAYFRNISKRLQPSQQH
jgi:hypothetical protein